MILQAEKQLYFIHTVFCFFIKLNAKDLKVLKDGGNKMESLDTRLIINQEHVY